MLDSPAYLALSHPAKALLIELARQHRGGDNGRLILTDRHLRPRGWNSPAVIQRAKRELLDAELIFETVKGARPNKASWYAMTWRALDKIDGYDSGASGGFERGAYLKKKPLPKNAAFTSSPVVETPRIATAPVVETPSPTTSRVAIRPVLTPSPTTARVVPLELPSTGARIGSGAVELDPAAKGGKVPARRTKPTTCKRADCETITLGHEFCEKHRHLASTPRERDEVRPC